MGHLEFTALTGYFVDDGDFYLHKGLRSLLRWHEFAAMDNPDRLRVLPLAVLYAWWSQLRRHREMDIPTSVCHNNRDGHCICDLAGTLPAPVSACCESGSAGSEHSEDARSGGEDCEDQDWPQFE